MMNRKNMTASTLDETALDAYYTLTESGANYGCLLYTSPSPRDRV